MMTQMLDAEESKYSRWHAVSKKLAKKKRDFGWNDLTRTIDMQKLSR